MHVLESSVPDDINNMVRNVFVKDYGEGSCTNKGKRVKYKSNFEKAKLMDALFDAVFRDFFPCVPFIGYGLADTDYKCKSDLTDGKQHPDGTAPPKRKRRKKTAQEYEDEHCKGMEVVPSGSPSVVVCSENYQSLSAF